ncbi:hypothetical protein B0J13DRAFT_559874 [Dactylonectria estremocensis]|uniref:Uncharacterized protein n=1 Tax=Dactylonectria estremocensis TaxID=1079267 RepID=A0A9P9J051_9HYPO|nr:hypothetical protein B0J13DRAFT_559874 [Dactylonectria estremocensis]
MTDGLVIMLPSCSCSLCVLFFSVWLTESSLVSHSFLSSVTETHVLVKSQPSSFFGLSLAALPLPVQQEQAYLKQDQPGPHTTVCQRRGCLGA